MTNKYNRSKLYKLQCDDGYYYIGSTVQPLSIRLGGHKVDSKQKINQKVYSHINEIGWSQVKIVLISEHCLENREQLLREEDKLIKECRNDELCLNIKRAMITKDELKENRKIYRKENKEYIKEYRIKVKDKTDELKKEWYKKNKDKLLDKRKSYYYQNKDDILEKQKNYNNENKDKISKRGKEYYEKNKEKLLDKYICECGSEVVICSKLRHYKSKKHIEFMDSETSTGEIVNSMP